MYTIKIINPQLKELLKLKDTLVNKGRKISIKIEEFDKKIEEIKDSQRKYTNNCNPIELITKGDALQNKINGEIEELEKIGKEVERIKIEAIPKEIVKEYESLKKQKEDLETERNKIALKVQKIKDRAIPIIQKDVKPKLQDEYDDIETALIKGEQIHIMTFNHLKQWKEGFEKNRKKSYSNSTS
jgi:seryl-tRNA synthetase